MDTNNDHDEAPVEHWLLTALRTGKATDTEQAKIADELEKRIRMIYKLRLHRDTLLDLLADQKPRPMQMGHVDYCCIRCGKTVHPLTPYPCRHCGLTADEALDSRPLEDPAKWPDGKKITEELEAMGVKFQDLPTKIRELAAWHDEFLKGLLRQGIPIDDTEGQKKHDQKIAQHRLWAYLARVMAVGAYEAVREDV